MDDSGGEVVGSYQFSGGASVGSDVVESGGVKPVNVTRVSCNQPVQVGKAVAKTPKRDKTGAQIIDDPATLHEPQAVRTRSGTQIPCEGNIGIDMIREGGATGDVDEALTGDNLTDLLPGAAVAGRVRRVPKPAPVNESDEITEIVAGWSIRRHWRKRVDEALSCYGDWPEAIDAICEKESIKVVEQIRSKIANRG